MFISKKKWAELVKRVSDLEKSQSRTQEIGAASLEKAKVVSEEIFYRNQIGDEESEKLIQFIDEIITN